MKISIYLLQIIIRTNQLERNLTGEPACTAAPDLLFFSALSVDVNPASIFYHTFRKNEKRDNTFWLMAQADQVTSSSPQEQAQCYNRGTC